MNAPQTNLVAAWVGIVLGFVGGSGLGMFFRREDWLGGYGSFKRRLYRLAHISLFGLAFVNLAFYLTAQTFTVPMPGLQVASWSFLLGAATMPICSVILAHRPCALPLFAIPVVSLIVGGCITLALLI